MGMHKKIYFCTNTKMYKGYQETLDYLMELKQLTEDIDWRDIELSVMIPYTTLYQGKQILQNSSILLGAQNMCWEQTGPYTGEISPLMLQELGVKSVLLGHSERRNLFGESDEKINRKVRSALAHEMVAFFSISDTEADKRKHQSDDILCKQLKIGLCGVEKEQVSKVRILYEPSWAIGEKGIFPTIDFIKARHVTIKKCLCELWGKEVAMQIPVIYGGSVCYENAWNLIRQENVDGLGIGRNAWDPKNFNRIIRMVLKNI